MYNNRANGNEFVNWIYCWLWVSETIFGAKPFGSFRFAAESATLSQNPPRPPEPPKPPTLHTDKQTDRQTDRPRRAGCCQQLPKDGRNSIINVYSAEGIFRFTGKNSPERGTTTNRPTDRRRLTGCSYSPLYGSSSSLSNIFSDLLDTSAADENNCFKNSLIILQFLKRANKVQSF